MVPASCLGQVDNEKQNTVTALVEVGMCPGQQGQDGTNFPTLWLSGSQLQAVYL